MSLNDIFRLLKEKERCFINSTVYQFENIDNDNFLRRAQYASMKRLISCMVNERFLEATLVSVDGDEFESKIAILTPRCNKSMVLEAQHDDHFYYTRFIAKPILDKEQRAVTLLDPDECGPIILEEKNGQLIEIRDPLEVVRRLLRWRNVDKQRGERFHEELADSIQRQEYKYRFPPKDPTFDSSITEWEQSIVEGHATHPMHRSRYAVPPLAKVPISNDISDATINFVAVEKSSMIIRGPYDETMTKLMQRLTIEGGLENNLSANHVIVPVHHLQLPNVFLRFPDTKLLPFITTAKAQASLRTVTIDNFPDYNMKLPLGLITTSSMRTITPWTAFIGPGLKPILQAVVKDKRFIAALEVASVCSKHADINEAKHFSAIFRENIDVLIDSKNEIAIPCMALTELTNQGTARVTELFRLDTEDKRSKWFESYTRVLLEIFIPPIALHGFALEAHAQNTILRLDSRTKEIIGFVVRDFGGFKCHQPTLKLTTGLWIETYKKGGFIEAENLKSVNLVGYHTLIHCHLNRFIRVLGLHYNDLGWSIVRKILTKLSQSIDKEAPNYALFHDWLHHPKTDYKCFIKMKLESFERDYLYESVPNILYVEEN